MLTERIGQALALAVEAHNGQLRKGTKIPYVSHVMGVASIALDFGADEDQAIAALLHDALEDGGPHFAPIIAERFGPRVLSIVEGCTDGLPDPTGKKADWHDRKRAYIAHLFTASDDVLIVSASDKLHNARAILSDLQTVGPAVWERFSTKKEGTLWYYRSLADLFASRGTPMSRQINETVAAIEHLAT